MFKKMMLLAVSVGALVAFAAPAVAQANVYLYEINAAEEEVVLGNHAGVTATSTNLVTTLEGGGQLECGLVTLHLEVQTNGLNHVVLKQLGEATTTNCKLNEPPNLLNATITDGTLGAGAGQEHKITINTWGTGTTGAHFAADVGGGTCTLDGSVHVLGTNGTDILHVGPSLLTATPNPPCRNGTIEGTFTTETSDGTPVFLHSVTT